MNPVGIMQGRLSPPVPGRPQAFPWTSWRQEFHRARACGFDGIEWLITAERHEDNPIWSAPGRQAIRDLVTATGVEVSTVCAHYLQERPLVRVTAHERARSTAVLLALIDHAASLGVRTILVPVLEMSEVRTDTEKAELLEALRGPLDAAAVHGLRLGLETELPADEYRALIEAGNHPALCAYYDVGNAAAKGFDAAADVRALGALVGGVHIKDRPRGGPSVPLGQGDADLPGFFRALAATPYAGPVVLEMRSSGDYEAAAIRQRQTLREAMRGTPEEGRVGNLAEAGASRE